MSLKDKNIVVTGGSRGLGLGLVEALVAQGAKVTVVARDTGALAWASTAAEEAVMARPPSTVSRLPAVAAITASTATVIDTRDTKGSCSWAACSACSACSCASNAGSWLTAISR